MGIFEVIEEQAIIGFSGKINFQSKVDGHFIGSIFLLDGKICNCHFDKTQEIKAMVSLYIYLAENNEFQVILEPEIIAIHQSKIDIPISRIKKLCEKKSIKIEQGFYLNKNGKEINNPLNKLFNNFFSTSGLFVLKK